MHSIGEQSEDTGLRVSLPVGMEEHLVGCCPTKSGLSLEGVPCLLLPLSYLAGGISQKPPVANPRLKEEYLVNRRLTHGVVVGLKFVPYSDDDVKWMEREDNRLEKQQTKSGVNGRLRREKREKCAWEELLAKEEIRDQISYGVRSKEQDKASSTLYDSYNTQQRQVRYSTQIGVEGFMQDAATIPRVDNTEHQNLKCSY